MGSTDPVHEDHPATTARNARYGLVLFVIYLLLYAGFVGLNAFSPETMGRPTPWGGANLALVYGVGLIVAALVLALVYMALCRRNKGD